MITSLSLLLLADIIEVLGSLVGLFMLVLWVVGQLMEGKKQMNRPPAQGAPRQQAPPQRPVAAQLGAQPPAVGGIRGEMEDFLRRSAGQQPGRPAAQRKPQPAQVDKIEVLLGQPGKAADRRLAEPSRPLAQRTETPQRPDVAKPTNQSGPRPPRRLAAKKRDTVADHVAQHIALGTRSVAEQASHLGQRIVQDDAEFDVQLKAKFDHDVGTLAARRAAETPADAAAAAANSPSPAAQLAALLASPNGVRQAIVMNEILRRPSERW